MLRDGGRYLLGDKRKQNEGVFYTMLNNAYIAIGFIVIRSS